MGRARLGEIPIRAKFAVFTISAGEAGTWLKGWRSGFCAAGRFPADAGGVNAIPP